MTDNVEMIEGLTHFIVEFSEHTKPGEGRGWWHNKTAQVLTTDIYRVLDIFRAEHPEARVHVVRRLAPTARVYLDFPANKENQP